MKRLLIVLLGLLPGIGQAAVLLWYQEQEAGTEPQKVRYLVTDAFLRIDDGGSENGFVLLDRKQHQVYNVVPDTRSVLVIDGRGALPAVPDTLHIREQRRRDQAAPVIAGRATLEIEVSANDKRCYTGIVVPGLLDDVGRALAEFKRVLAVHQQRTIDNTPAEFQTPCFVTRYLYAPARHLNHGVPLEEWDEEGDRRRLLDYDAAFSADAALFRIPPAYVRYAPGEVLRSGDTPREAAD